MSLIVSSLVIFGALTGLIISAFVIAEKHSAARSQVKIHLNGHRQLAVASGTTLLEALALHQIILPSACGGNGRCTTCKCQLSSAPFREALACQFIVDKDMEIFLPSTVFSARKYSALVRSNQSISPTTKELILEIIGPDLLPCRAGTSLQFLAPLYGQPKPATRAFSLTHLAPAAKILIFKVKNKTEHCSQYLYNLKAGDEACFTGPHQAFSARQKNSTQI